MMTVSESDRTSTFVNVKGVPSLLAIRTLMITGACAVENESFSALKTLMNEPLEVMTYAGDVSATPFWQKRKLFWPQAIGGRGDLFALYLNESFSDAAELAEFFADSDSFLRALCEFQLIVALADAKRAEDDPIYPGYKLNPQSRYAIRSFLTRLSSSEDFLASVAQAIGDSPDEFRANWESRVERMNSVHPGTQRWPGFGVRLPATIGEPPDFDL